MEEILRKLLFKWFIHGISNIGHKESLHILMTDKEETEYYNKMKVDVEKHIEESLNQLKNILEDNLNDIEFNMSIMLNKLRNKYNSNDEILEIGMEINPESKDEWEIEENLNSDEQVICDSHDCDMDKEYCIHKIPHAYDESDCDTYCSYKKTPLHCVPYKKEKEKKIVICDSLSDCKKESSCVHKEPHEYDHAKCNLYCAYRRSINYCVSYKKEEKKSSKNEQVESIQLSNV